MDEGAGLENRYGFIPIVGSNPTLSATIIIIHTSNTQNRWHDSLIEHNLFYRGQLQLMVKDSVQNESVVRFVFCLTKKRGKL